MEEDNKTALTYYYSKPYQGKRYRENNTESMIVPVAIKVMAWIALLCGVIGIFSDNGHGSWMSGLGVVASSVFLFGFSAIVKAVYKYLDD